MSLPLSGIKILDASRVLASPFAAYQLSLLGAVVIKVENPLTRGDPSRHGGIGRRDAVNAAMAASFLSLSANKRSITLNLATKKGQEIFRRLAGEADDERAGRWAGFDKTECGIHTFLPVAR